MLDCYGHLIQTPAMDHLHFVPPALGEQWLKQYDYYAHGHLVLYLQQFLGASMRAAGTQLFQTLYLWIRPIFVFNEPKEKSHALRGKARTRLCELFTPPRHEEPNAGDSTSVIFTPNGPLVYSWQIDR